MSDTEHVTANAADAAIMYLCGADAKACKKIQLPETIHNMVFSRKLYQNQSIRGAALKAIALMEKGRACVWSNSIYKNIDEDGPFMVSLNDSHDTSSWIKPGAKELFHHILFRGFVGGCRDAPIIGVNLILERNEGDAHSNMMVINRRRKELEHFEPWGASWSYTDINDKHQKYIDDVKNLFTFLFPDYTYLPPSQTCPTVFATRVRPWGPQKIQARLSPASRVPGACVVWSFWYLHLRINHPDEAPSVTSSRAIMAAMGVPMEKLSDEDIDPACWTLGIRGNCSNLEDPDRQRRLREKCKTVCEFMDTMSMDKFDEFLVKFTTQIITLINLKIMDIPLAHCEMDADRQHCTNCSITGTRSCVVIEKYNNQRFGCIDKSVPDAEYTPPVAGQAPRRRSGRARTGRRRSGRAQTGRRRSGRATPARRAALGRCSATTTQGTRCKRASTHGKRCTQHAQLVKANATK